MKKSHLLICTFLFSSLISRVDANALCDIQNLDVKKNLRETVVFVEVVSFTRSTSTLGDGKPIDYVEIKFNSSRMTIQRFINHKSRVGYRVYNKIYSERAFKRLVRKNKKSKIIINYDKVDRIFKDDPSYDMIMNVQI